MGNIFYFAGKSYYISKEEQEEFTLEFGISCLYVGEHLHLKWHDNADKPTLYLSKIIEINSIKFNDEYHKAKNIKEKYNEFLKSNVIFSDEKDYVQVFGNLPINFSRSGECVSFEKSVKEEQLRKILEEKARKKAEEERRRHEEEEENNSVLNEMNIEEEEVNDEMNINEKVKNFMNNDTNFWHHFVNVFNNFDIYVNNSFKN